MRSSREPGLFAGVSGAARPQRPAPPKRRPLVAGLSIALGLTTLWAAGASWYLLFHDESLARYLTQQHAIRTAYEARLGALQLQVDRAAAERLLQRDGIEGRLIALTERQALIEKRQGELAGLGGTDVDTTGSIALPPAQPAPPAAPQKPFPTPDAFELRMRGGDRTETLERRIAPKLAGLESRMDRLGERQFRALSGLTARAGRTIDRLRGVILSAGLEPARFERPAPGLGGPLVPVNGDAFELALAEARRASGDEERLRRTIAALPFRKPLRSDFAYTSGFGTRLDPFTRGLALHTGVDLRADYGASARATAAGRITAAEYAGGYGNMVEIDHGHGVATRYAHLSSFAVSPGQWVEAGAVVGRVGSTGRSTGNHLHYETRVDGEPVDPQRFLRAAATLDDVQR